MFDARPGAYGLCVTGIGADRSALIEAPDHWPSYEVRARVSDAPALVADRLDDRTAELRLRSGGSVFVDRAAARATFSLPALPSPAALVHPHLAALAVVAAHWDGRDSFHAGGFAAGDGVWAVLGDKGAGKSSTLASLAKRGVPVFSDDVLVLDGELALAGPRAIDLRGDAAQQLGGSEPLGVIGTRERWRLGLDPVAPELPFKGWVRLRWSPEATVEPVRGAERLRELYRHRGIRVATEDPQRLIELSSLPFLELSRPNGWGSIEDSLTLLLDALATL